MDRKKHEIGALSVLIVTLLVLLSLLSFRNADPTFLNASVAKCPAQNLVGSFGALVACGLFNLLGIGAYILPVVGFGLSWSLFRGMRPPQERIHCLGILFLLFSVTSLAALQQENLHLFGQEIMSGGIVGAAIAHFLKARLSTAGTLVLLVGLLLIALLLSTPLTLNATIGFFHRMVAGFFGWSWGLVGRIGRRGPGGTIDSGRKAKKPSSDGSSREKEPPQPEPVAAQLAPARKKPRKNAAVEPPPSEPGCYTLPSIDLLDVYENPGHKPDPKKLEENAKILEEKLADFGVQGNVVGICPGPVITMYEYAPAPGIKISRIVGLSDDLSMALKATSIRVVAPIPGKAAIGIELPNSNRELVSIRDVLESASFNGSASPLTIALGKDITGQPVVANLAKMPHLLIAGATGTGKSVGINCILSSLLYRNTPDDLRILLIDPKRIELSSYEGIPHLIHPVVTDAKMATRALKWAVQEMELRYKLLADKNVRNIESYNKALAKQKAKEAAQNPPATPEAPLPELPHHKLPYIVIIIDELADLMMVASREVEEYITRLAQMARAAGLHLILATQRPSVDVITGIIKANVPTRISFQVSSKIDSRTIIDGSGAESLLGMGDMLFLPPGTAKLQRIHGAFVSDNEVQSLTQFWRPQQHVEDPLRERVDFHESDTADDIDQEELDDRYEEAVQIVLETRQASISMLQRRLRVGYNRAARMIEVMEQQGIVGASDGIKPREVIGRRDS
ncbi:MAG: DNA translocase FtsK 4TM domain-containing protein [Syntrophobacteraceae bacterium]|nr:DNA translocase FtsK 4TM domain-containing protein [Desulfobacteraceae bacterium]